MVREMASPKTVTTTDGTTMHFSVGAIIKRDDKYLLINRAVPPLGFAGIAGHVDEGEEPLEALRRELKEEGSLILEEATLLFEEVCKNNSCSKGITIHHWYLYDCKVSGTIKRNLSETKSIGSYSKEEIKKLALEPVWKHWFKRLKIV